MAQKITTSDLPDIASRNIQTISPRVSRISVALSWLFLLVLGLLPLHAFFTTWLGSNFGYLDAWRIWKELLLVAALPLVVWLLVAQPSLWRRLWRQWLIRLIAAYIVLYVVSGVLALMQHNTNVDALAYALLSNLRYLGFFLMVLVVIQNSNVLHRWAVKVVVSVSGIVIGFGLLQRFALPLDFLRHFGYGADTIPAYQTVDNKVEYQRIQSTLRGANPLGAYLTVIIGLLASYWRAFWAKRWAAYLLSCVATLAALFFTYSRSAYLGVSATVVIVLLLGVSVEWRKRLLLAGIGIALLGAGFVYVFRDNNALQNTLFHSDETSQSDISSNTGRTSAIKEAFYQVLREPLGRGPGTAGPASVRNDHPARIAENYFLQIGQEVGWVGLALFMLILMLVGVELWAIRSTPLGLGLFASFIGLFLINLVSHAWADDTLGLLWWGLAGVALGRRLTK